MPNAEGKFTILVVDDNDAKRLLLKTFLDREGYAVVEAVDGADGFDLVRQEKPDLIITDIMMPRMDGYELTRRIRLSPETKFIPVIIQSAKRVSDDDKSLGLRLGGLDYFTGLGEFEMSALMSKVKLFLEMKANADRWQEAALTDELTKLANRRYFERQLAHEVEMFNRYGGTFSLLALDLDHFKAVNDTYGHDVGDLALVFMAGMLVAETRSADVPARTGGEEFSVLLPATPIDRAVAIAERIRVSIEAGAFHECCKLTVSIGVVGYEGGAPVGVPPAKTSADAVKMKAAADAALYEAKRTGRNRVVAGAATDA